MVFLQKLQETLVLILMHVDESSAKFQTKRAKSWPIYNSNITNKFLDILMDKLPKNLPPSHNVDHKIEMVPWSRSSFMSPYRLNF